MKIIFTIIWASFLISPCLSQDYIGPAPDPMGIIRQVSVGVGHYTGTQNTSIALGSVSGRELGASASLSYNSFGHRVQDVASSEGLGWNLQAGGMITRVVRGLPDDGPGGFCQSNPSDTEPDLFIFSFLGRSGKFVVNANGSVALFPFQDLKINVGMCGNGETWEIIDENGTRYLFGTSIQSREKSTSKKLVGSALQQVFTSTWYLAKVISMNGTDEINLSYISSNYSYINYFFEKDDGPCPASEKNESTRITIQGKNLSEITTSGGKMEFEWNQSRLDLPGAKSLASVSVKDNEGELVSKFYFEYGYFEACLTDETLCKRLKLEKVYDLSPQPLYEFQYIEFVNLPARNSKKIDYLGLYNNNLVDSWIPSISSPVSYSGASRVPDPSRMKANLLERIDQRGGSYRLFDYEPHSGYEGTTSVPVISGNRIKNIYHNGIDGYSETVKYTYLKEGSEQSSGILFRKPIFGYSKFSGTPNNYHIKRYSHTYNEMFDVNGTHVGYSRVQEELVGKGYKVFTFTNFDQYPDQDLSGNGTSMVPPFMSTTSRFWERGNLLSTTIRASDYSEIVYKELYEYNFDHPNKLTVSGTKNLHVSFSCLTGTSTGTYEIVSKPFTLKKKTTESYDQEDPNSKLVAVEEYAYDPVTYQLLESTSYNPALNGEKYVKKYKYASHPDYNYSSSQFQACNNNYNQCIQQCDVNNTTCWETCYTNYVSCLDMASTDEQVIALQALRNKHAHNVLVEEQNWLDKGSMVFLGANLSLFKRVGTDNNLIVPDSRWSSKKVTGTYTGSSISSGQFVLPSSFVKSNSYDTYNNNGTLTKQSDRDGTISQYTWTYNDILLAQSTVHPDSDPWTKSYGYKPLIGPVLETDINNKSIGKEYDHQGRLRLLKDSDGNILERYRYHYQNETPGLRILSDKEDALVNQTINFSLEEIISPSGGIPEFAWDMDNGTVYDDSRLTAEASYGSQGSYEVKTVMFTNEFAPFTAIKQVFVWTPLNYSLCIDGPQIIDLCYQDPVTFGSCTEENTQPTSPTTFKVNFSSQGCPNVNTFLWEYKKPSSSSWIGINSLGSSATLPFHQYESGTYEVRCTFTDGCNTTVTRSTYVNFYKSNQLCY
jgi:YD repeat-containing protein